MASERNSLAGRSALHSHAPEHVATEALVEDAGIPAGPSIERGQVVDFKPSALPPAPGPTAAPSEAEQREMAKTMLGLDEEQMQVVEAPVLTADAVVRITEVGSYIAVRMRTISKRRGWDAEKAEAARFTPGAREDIKAFAPFALPYLQKTAAANPWVGLGLFGLVAWSAVGDSLERVSSIERARGEDLAKPGASPTDGKVLTLMRPVETAPRAPGPPIFK
jgi:hypothetical protein